MHSTLKLEAGYSIHESVTKVIFFRDTQESTDTSCAASLALRFLVQSCHYTIICWIES